MGIRDIHGVANIKNIRPSSASCCGRGDAAVALIWSAVATSSLSNYLVVPTFRIISRVLVHDNWIMLYKKCRGTN